MFNKYKVHKYYKLNSTNSYLVDKYSLFDNFSVIFSTFQEHGKGRNNNKWISDSSSNIYFSILIKDTSFLALKTHLPVLVALSLYNTISTYTKKIKIKWPNDIVEDSKSINKIAGVLIEDFNNHIIIGIGVNLKYSPSIDSTYMAQNIYNLSKLKKNISKLAFIKCFMNNFNAIIDEYKLKSFIKISNYYNENLFMKNKNIYIKDIELRYGTLIGIDENGFLILKEGNKLKKYFNGEIKITCN